MLQKRNDFEIVEIIRQEPMHMRGIAAKLGLVPSTVMRILHRLLSERVVDTKTEGRNKKYYIKDAAEGRHYLYMTEHYKLMKAVQNPVLRYICDQLIEHTSGEMIVLFGSQAKGTAHKRSDVDIYIETDDQKIREELSWISTKLSIKIGTNRTNSELWQEIINNHIIIQGVEQFYQLENATNTIY